MLGSTFQSLAAILMLSICAVFAQAQGVITVRLSYKIILNPADGTRPMNNGARVTDNDIDTAIAGMNRLSAAYFRGFRFRRVDAVTNVGGMNAPNGPSQYFNTDFRTAGRDARNQIETAARGDAAYAWNNGAINIYINQ